MPSPFPGIDPYLESPLYWPDFHERFLPYAAEMLQPQLPNRYRARIGERVILEAVERTIIPDLTVVQRPAPRDTEVHRDAAGMALDMDTPAIFSAFPDEIREAFVEIIDRVGQRVITVIELLSPTNKTPGAGREQYAHKQREVLLRSGTNLVEIDLLHGGTHTVAVPHANLARHAPFHGLVSVWRAAQPQQYEVYFVRLQERLPRLRIPLLPDDHDVALDLPASTRAATMPPATTSTWTIPSRRPWYYRLRIASGWRTGCGTMSSRRNRHGQPPRHGGHYPHLAVALPMLPRTPYIA